ncbi:P-loop containing nucleoside triphosphate hydrolase protein [Gloeophyllum trabeum ATCC 11539]|uniref:p-loop containing nucleoside triphosphate hydrolase protein n=1 Tax=Gloeophyllum trabeum (strain ATCC 11539 / FP-39264 / Madison 617) TaxID=670483 RepID=S7QNU9_GLOTA|nr:P-loop containing nucleoside triphosphate hydrolase protein [Gloeophyllum trabeum ATCC 11539]EPQ61246.1 P-loop containing nucleoside triphosphate hydrolase protein [Gloeophyllum trabeum ATCC 11539]
MDAIATELAQFLVQRLQTVPASSRLLVGISGIPASGKSTLAELVVDNVNEILHGKGGEGDVTAVLVGLDGWHLTRAQLDAFPDPKLAHDRRGAHWTFDGDAYVEFVKSLRLPLSLSSVVTAPSFDHALKDPTPHAVSIHPHHRIVVIEGLYTFLSIEPWRRAGEFLDERWFVDISVEEATRRLVKRHVVSGVAKDKDEAIWRANNNDMPNGQFIIDNLLDPTRRIASVNDPVFTTE